MMWWHSSMEWGGWIAMVLAMVVFWSLVIFGLLMIFRGDRESRPDRGLVERSPEQLLDERFARGEIDAEEYHARRDTLRAAH